MSANAGRAPVNSWAKENKAARRDSEQRTNQSDQFTSKIPRHAELSRAKLTCRQKQEAMFVPLQHKS